MNLKEDWNNRYKTGNMGWDIGHISPPLKKYFDQLDDKNAKILIPGCGNAYEAEYLHKKGFKNVFLLDVAPIPLKNFKKRLPDFPENHLLQNDFFKYEGKYDLIIEQTFFSAIDPVLREEYAKKIKSLLKPGGKLVGLLFDDPLFSDHPPYGGDKDEYLSYFKPHFKIEKFETAYNSIESRMGREFFIILVNEEG